MLMNKNQFVKPTNSDVLRQFLKEKMRVSHNQLFKTT